MMPGRICSDFFMKIHEEKYGPKWQQAVMKSGHFRA
jgi:hypothetical protein